MHNLPTSGGYREALDRGYRHAGGCSLSFCFGVVPVHFTRRDLPLVIRRATPCDPVPRL